MLWVRPFKRGDYITISELGRNDKTARGVVLSIDYHYVSLRTNEGDIILLPTNAVYGKVVEQRVASRAP